MFLPLFETAFSWVHGTTVAFHGTTARTRYYRNQHGSNFLLPLVEQYYRPRRGTSARAVLPQGHAVLLRSSERVGVKSGQGEFQLPHTHSSFSPPVVSLSLSLAEERCRRPSLDLRLRPLSSDPDRWDHSPPLPLAMEQGFSPNPSSFCLFFCL